MGEMITAREKEKVRERKITFACVIYYNKLHFIVCRENFERAYCALYKRRMRGSLSREDLQ